MTSFIIFWPADLVNTKTTIPVRVVNSGRYIPTAIHLPFGDSCILLSKYGHLDHAIENTANEIARKPLYIRQYSTEPSFVHRIDYVKPRIFYDIL